MRADCDDRDHVRVWPVVPEGAPRARRVILDVGVPDIFAL